MKKAKSVIVPRMKTFDQTHKGKKGKLDATNIKNAAAFGTPWVLVDPSKLPTIQHK